MTQVEMIARINSDVTAKGPDAAKTAAAGLIDDLVGAGVDPTRTPKFGPLNHWREAAAASDGTAGVLGPIVTNIVRSAIAGSGDTAMVIATYTARWV